jgi:hypothetical protein
MPLLDKKVFGDGDMMRIVLLGDIDVGLQCLERDQWQQRLGRGVASPV